MKTGLPLCFICFCFYSFLHQQGLHPASRPVSFACSILAFSRRPSYSKKDKGSVRHRNFCILLERIERGALQYYCLLPPFRWKRCVFLVCFVFVFSFVFCFVFALYFFFFVNSGVPPHNPSISFPQLGLQGHDILAI